MPKNKLKEKVDQLTKTVKLLIEDLLKIDSMARGTLTAFQLHIGKEDWSKVLKEREKTTQTYRPKDEQINILKR